ncbi:MAG: LysR family transcriptional regulator [Rhodospirillales bacterium]|nr:LysR family transcriptional regulator [Rhodospirillales bacterium]
MDWDRLRVFHAVAQAGSFTHAGEALGLSQSAVSRQISTLEESLGVALFTRHARGLILTEQGELLARSAQEIFAKLAMVEGQLSDSRQSPDGNLSVTVAEFIGSTWLAPRLKGFHTAHPGIRLTLLLDDRIYNLGLREADAAIRLYKPDHPELIQRHLSTIGFQICAAKSYLKSRSLPQGPNDLKNHTLIGYPPGIPAPFPDPNWLFRVAEMTPEDHPDSLMINSIHGTLNAVRAGMGIAALPSWLVRENKDLTPILPEITHPGIPMYFVYPEERRDSIRIGVFRNYLLEMVAATAF